MGNKLTEAGTIGVALGLLAGCATGPIKDTTPTLPILSLSARPTLSPIEFPCIDPNGKRLQPDTTTTDTGLVALTRSGSFMIPELRCDFSREAKSEELYLGKRVRLSLFDVDRATERATGIKSIITITPFDYPDSPIEVKCGSIKLIGDEMYVRSKGHCPMIRLISPDPTPDMRLGRVTNKTG